MKRNTIFPLTVGFISLFLLVSAGICGSGMSDQEYEAMSQEMLELNTNKQYQVVIGMYEKYAVPENQNFRFYRELGDAYLLNEIRLSKTKKIGDWEKAEQYFQKAHSLRRDDLYVIMNLAVLYTWKNDNFNANQYAGMYLKKGGKKRAKQAETILQKYKFNIIEQGSQ